MKNFCPGNLVFILMLVAGSYLLSYEKVFAQSAVLSIEPTSGTFNRGCPFTLNVNIDTGGADTDGLDAYLFYDTSRITGVSVTKGTAYNEIPGSSIDASTGKISIAAIADFSKPFKGKGTVATLNFNVKENAPTGATQIRFDFSRGSTTDSNIAQTNAATDILGSVVDGSYTIGTGACSSSSQDATKTNTGGGTGVGGRGQAGYATPSGQLGQGGEDIFKQPPPKKLPPAGSEELTFTLAIIGTTLTILGLIGLAIL